MLQKVHLRTGHSSDIKLKAMILEYIANRSNVCANSGQLEEFRLGRDLKGDSVVKKHPVFDDVVTNKVLALSCLQ